MFWILSFPLHQKSVDRKLDSNNCSVKILRPVSRHSQKFKAYNFFFFENFSEKHNFDINLSVKNPFFLNIFNWLLSFYVVIKNIFVLQIVFSIYSSKLWYPLFIIFENLFGILLQIVFSIYSSKLWYPLFIIFENLFGILYFIIDLRQFFFFL